MNNHPKTPFDSIESSHEYIAMLADAIAEAKDEVDADVSEAESERAVRRRDALQLVSFNLSKLSSHIKASQRILNDLRTLRRLLLEERSSVARGAGGS